MWEEYWKVSFLSYTNDEFSYNSVFKISTLNSSWKEKNPSAHTNTKHNAKSVKYQIIIFVNSVNTIDIFLIDPRLSKLIYNYSSPWKPVYFLVSVFFWD